MGTRWNLPMAMALTALVGAGAASIPGCSGDAPSGEPETYGGYGDVQVRLTDIQANNNTYGTGIMVLSYNGAAYGGISSVSLEDIAANNNYGMGIMAFSAAAYGESQVAIDDTTANNNFGMGIMANAVGGGPGGTAQLDLCGIAFGR